jgi:hypothetical protein
MRILQLIDSLEAGGAERMAVNYANALQQIEFSGLVSTRNEGALKNQLNQSILSIFNKKKCLDFRALGVARYVIENKIEWVHVHSTSFLWHYYLNFVSYQIIWHDHYGDSEF